MTTMSASSDLIATARSLRPEIEAFSDECQRLRHLPDGVARLLREHRIFGMARPPELGGLGVDLYSALRTVEELSIADASVGWCAAIGSGSIGQIQLAEEVAREIFRPGICVAGVGSPSGRALPVDGGYRVTGRWAYASGCQTSEWIFMGNLVFEGDRPRLSQSGGPELRIAIVPVSDVEIIDTWHTSGLRGTGSHDIAVQDLFVPAERTALVDVSNTRGQGREIGIPMFTLFGLALTPVALGAARRALDELIALAQGKTPMMAGSKLREKPVVQHEVARAEATLEAGRTYFYDMVSRLLDRANRGEEIDMAFRARVRLAATHATECAAQAADIAYRLGGGSANYESSVLQRCFRDAHAVTQHFMLSYTNYEVAGRVLLGLEPVAPVLF